MSHGQKKKSNKAQKQPDFQCSKCNKIIRTNIGITRHSELFCEQYNECSPERTSFDNHMGVKHKDKDPFMCGKCKTSFDVEQNLNRQI